MSPESRAFDELAKQFAEAVRQRDNLLAAARLGLQALAMEAMAHEASGDPKRRLLAEPIRGAMQFISAAISTAGTEE